MARVGRRGRDDRRGRARPHRPRPPRLRAARATPTGALKIGSFSAASNVTGIITDVDQIAITAASPRRAVLLGLRGRRPVSADRHERGAGASPTGSSPTRTRCSSPRTSSSAVPGRPACSSPSASLLRNRVPSVPGGGTVLFVSPSGHAYHPDPEIREEGGTPGIVESIRAGLVFALKDAVGMRRDPPARARLRPPRAALVGRQPADRDPRQHASSSGWRSCRFGLRHPRRSPARELRRRACSATCSASRRAAAASAPAPTSTACTAIDERWSDAHGRRGREGPRGREARVHPDQLQLLHQRGGVRATSSTPSTCSPTRAGSCCRCTASTRAPACGATAPRRRGPAARPARRARVTPRRRLATAPESVLAGQLEARARDHRRASQSAPADRPARRSGR